ncbi:MAG: hypothetical protein OSJ61_03610 [Lachnospiraceae bacterium]|nr:hypothetical protein [Lachnospiraceae bacterium]
MPYTTTKIKAVKSYPTYQLHAESLAEKVSAEEVFKICILETYQWIRSRLESFDSIPVQLDMPSPDKYESLKLDELYSFSIDTGFTIDVVYVRSKKIWSFSITEPDMGANIGTENERQPVFGRSFCTDISFRIIDKSVEIGVRTVCSEPVDTTADCEVFRPALVKSLANNPLVGLKEFFSINGQAVDVATKGAAERLIMYVEKYEDSLPIVLVCSAGTKVVGTSDETKHANLILINPLKVLETIDPFSSSGIIFPKSRFTPDVREMEINVDLSNLNLDIKKPFEKAEKEKDSKISPIKVSCDTRTGEEKAVQLDNIDYSLIARYSLGYAHVCFVSEQCIEYISNKFSNSLHTGDIVVIYGGEVIKKYGYSSYCDRMDEFQMELRKIIISLPKGRTVRYGKIRFHTDARLLEIEEKRTEYLSYEEKFSLLSIENDELKRKIKELEQLNVGKSVGSEEFRRTMKKVRSLEEENEKLQIIKKETSDKLELISTSYKYNAEIIEFYKYKAAIAARFPVHKDDICDWIEKEFSDCIILTPNVRSELKKYSGEMDVAMLCDGILFLHGYARYRKDEIDSKILDLYAETGKWQIEGCGVEALKVYKDDYSACVNGRKYLMDMHIKYGVNPRMLIRIYFCWDELSKRIIIGHMPEHLATLKQNT